MFGAQIFLGWCAAIAAVLCAHARIEFRHGSIFREQAEKCSSAKKKRSPVSLGTVSSVRGSQTVRHATCVGSLVLRLASVIHPARRASESISVSPADICHSFSSILTRPPQLALVKTTWTGGRGAAGTAAAFCLGRQVGDTRG